MIILIEVADLSNVDNKSKHELILDKNIYSTIRQCFILRLPKVIFITKNQNEYFIIDKLREIPHVKLESFIDEDKIQRGISPDLKEAFLVNEEIILKYNLEKTKLRKVVTGGTHVKRYFIDYPRLWVIYSKHDDNFHQMPNICKYIRQFRDKITCKEVKDGKHSIYSLHRPRNEKIFLKNQKIFGVITSDRISVTLDEKKTFATDGLFLFGVKSNININYLLGILNSKLLVNLYRLFSFEKGRVLAQVKPTIIGELPIRTIDFDNLEDKARHDRMVIMVENMLAWHKKLVTTQTPQEQAIFKRQIASTDRLIDLLVYELYGLTDEEIKLVES